ncbi:MAG TPA: relaxase/mobilization nuclease domain-containing protein [Longimicrobiaceae bacterium]
MAACMMAATANAAVRGTAKPVFHFSVSLHPDDPVGPDIMQRIAERTLRDIGLEEHEAAVWWHKDRSHPHLQFVVNRVHPERGTVWKPWRDFYRLERSMRAQERELGLRVVPGYLAPAFAPEHAIEGHEPEHTPAAARLRPQPGPKRGDDAFLRDVIERATPVLERASSWAELQSGLAEEGLSIRVKG